MTVNKKLVGYNAAEFTNDKEEVIPYLQLFLRDADSPLVIKYKADPKLELTPDMLDNDYDFDILETVNAKLEPQQRVVKIT